MGVSDVAWLLLVRFRSRGEGDVVLRSVALLHPVLCSIVTLEHFVKHLIPSLGRRNAIETNLATSFGATVSPGRSAACSHRDDGGMGTSEPPFPQQTLLGVGATEWRPILRHVLLRCAH